MAARMRFEAPTESGEQRDCARGQFCAASVRDTDGAWHPAKSYAPFCAADQSMITASAEALPAAYGRLGEQIGQPARRGTAVRVPPGSRVLLNGDVDALIRMMIPVLAAWAVAGLGAAIATFRWEPHRPTQRRPARTAHPVRPDGAGPGFADGSNSDTPALGLEPALANHGSAAVRVGGQERSV